MPYAPPPPPQCPSRRHIQYVRGGIFVRHQVGQPETAEAGGVRVKPCLVGRLLAWGTARVIRGPGAHAASVQETVFLVDRQKTI